MKTYGAQLEILIDLILLTKISDNSDEKYMKIKFTSDDNLPLKKTW